ncbi:MAG: 50S ribosomal protein L15 [Flavobacteriales bacterium]
MKLSELKPAKGSVKTRKRIGRGEGSGLGGTSTKGHKGAKARTGYSSKPGFEGGQQPLQRRIPKFGFTNYNRVEYKAINLDVLQDIATKSGVSEITLEVLLQHGVISSVKKLVKVLGRGELKAKVNVSAHGFSKSAKEAIEAKGGSITTLK